MNSLFAREDENRRTVSAGDENVVQSLASSPTIKVTQEFLPLWRWISQPAKRAQGDILEKIHVRL